MLIVGWTDDDVHSSVIWSAFPGNDAGSHGIAIGEAAIYINTSSVDAVRSWVLGGRLQQNFCE